MDSSIQLSSNERKVLLKVYRSGKDVRVARRAHVLLLLGDGWSYRLIQQVTYASFDLIAGALRCYHDEGVAGVAGEPVQSPSMPWWLLLVRQWLEHRSPQEFGYYRSRWTCAMLAEALAWETGQRISEEKVRRGLQSMRYAWRRPRPVVGPKDPDYARKLRRIKRLLSTLPDQETVLFQDEVDVHLNPKIGACWMPCGQQVQVVTPGNNVKRHMAGSLVWRTGTLLVSAPECRRNAQLFVAHLDDLRRRLRGYRTIHVVCDNASFHNCRLVQDYLDEWGHRIKMHFLPKYAPETNPIERVWWHLHETITRNHRCQTIDELLDNVYEWLDAQKAFPIETSLYKKRAA
jgi:transposase